MDDRWRGPEEEVRDYSEDVVGYIRPYKASAVSDKTFWAFRNEYDCDYRFVVKNPNQRVRHKEIAQALVIASRYGQ